MLSQEARNALIGCESHGPKIITAALKINMGEITMNVILGYALINDINDADKYQPFQRLQSNIAKCTRKDLKLLMNI